MKKLAAVVGIALGAGACVPAVQETASLSCADFIGRPISERIAALGPPRSVYRITPTEVGYVFETKDTALVGGEPYYTVNYLTGADRHHASVFHVTRKCRGFVVQAPSPAIPVSQQVIVDVL